MVKREVTVVNPSGLHLRPAGLLSQTAMRYKSDIVIEAPDRRIIAKSVLNIMAAGVKCGACLTVICNGEDEQEALDAVCSAISSGLGEEIAK